MSSKSQMRMMETAETGNDTTNHWPQSKGSSISSRAIRFWGDEIGELWPPIFAAKAIASCKVGNVIR